MQQEADYLAYDMDVSKSLVDFKQPKHQACIYIASDLLKNLFSQFNGHLTIRLWDGSQLNLGQLSSDRLGNNHTSLNDAHINSALKAPFTLVFNHPRVLNLLVLARNPLKLAEAYFNGDMDIEGDFFAALHIKDYLNAMHLPVAKRLSITFSAVKLLAITKTLSSQCAGTQKGLESTQAARVKTHSKAENLDAIAFHYDVSNNFYALWLDKNMVYSCAYYEHPVDNLAQAQTAKLDHICRKLLLKPGELLLDIGCGWGALVIHAAQHYGVKAHGVTLSQQQLTFARERIRRAGLESSVTVELLDYRDIQGEAMYDKVASVGMFEHVGLKNLPIYFSAIHRLLKPAGLFLNHGITHDVEGWGKTFSTAFINRYIFPDGQLDTISNITRGMERSKFEIVDVEALRPHYALTLRAWVMRLEHHHQIALQYVSESTYRIWRLYMASSALEFERGELGIYQILVSKHALGNAQLPLTRRHLYADTHIADYGAETAQSRVMQHATMNSATIYSANID